MSTRDIKTLLSFEGEDEYIRKVKEINSEYSTLNSEMKVVQAQFAGNEKSVEALTAKSEVLSKQYDKQKEKLDVLKSALQAAQEAQEKANSKVEACREKYERAQQELDEYQKSTDKTAEGQKQLSEAVDRAGKELEIAERAQKKVSDAVEDYGRKSNYTQAEVYKLEKQLENTNTDLEAAKKEAEAAGKSVDELGDEMQEAAGKSREFGEKSKESVDALAAAIAASGVKEGLQEIAKAIWDSVEASMRFESAFTGVKKTVDGTPEQLQEISDGIKNMATEIPAATTEIAGVAEAAGQLGIARENVLDFTRVMIDLGESTNLSADEAASSLAKFANITGTAAENYGRLGSVIVGLGNNFATTEADIVSMGTRLASAGELAGMTEPEIMALATAMSSVGIEAQAGGTAMTQTINAMEKAVQSGGEKLELFASVAGMSAKEFANRWESSATAAIQAFISGLDRLDEQGESAVLVLEDLGLTGVRQSNMLKSLALASDQLGNAVNLANTAWEENVALAEEAGKRYETTESKVAMAKNALDNLKIAVGDQLNPVLENTAELGVDAFTWAAEFVEKNPEIVGAITAVTTAAGLLAVGVTGYGIATSAVIPLIHSFNAALASNPIGMVAVAAAGLVAALAGLTVAFQNTETTEYTNRLDAAKKATDELEESIERLEETAQSTDLTANQVQVYVRQLKRLEEQGLKTEAEQALFNKTLENIQDLLPDLVLEIDETTGAYEANTDVLAMNAEALLEQEKALSALEAYETARNAVESTTIAIEENRSELEMYQEELTELDELMSGANSTLEVGSLQWINVRDRIQELNMEIPFLMATEEMLNEELSLQKDMLAEAQAAYDQYNQTVAAGNSTVSEANNTYNTFMETLGGIETEIEDLKARYEESYKTAYENISGQMGLFEEMGIVVGKSVDDMIGSLQSQSEYMEEYANNLQKAAELGVDEGLLAHLSDGSVESAKLLKGIVEDGGKNVDELNKEFNKVEEGKKNFSDHVAKMNTDFDKNMDDIDKRLKKTVDEFDQKIAAIENTNSTIDGITQTAYSRVSSVRAAYANLAKQANAAYRSTLDIHSPSKVFEYNTRMTVDAITDTAKKNEPKVAQSYKELAGTASGAYYDATQKTQALYAQTIHNYNRYTSEMQGGISGTQMDQILGKMDKILNATENNHMDEDALAGKVGNAMSKVKLQAEARFSAREAARDLTPEVDKKQGAELALRKREVI